MRLVVVGATGATGREIVRRALADGHEVTALVRDPSRLPIEHDRLTVATASLFDPAGFAHHLEHADAVISALGAAGRDPRGLYSRGTASLAAAMRRAGTRRLVVIAAGAYVDSDHHPWWFRRIVQPLLLRLLGRVYADMRLMETQLARTDLQWTVVRPGRLTRGPERRRYRVTPDGFPRGGFWIARADVADFMIDCAVKHRFVARCPGIAN